MPDQTPEPLTATWPFGDLTPGTYTMTSTGDGPGDAVITDDGRLLVRQDPAGDGSFGPRWCDLTASYRPGIWDFEKHEPIPSAPSVEDARHIRALSLIHHLMRSRRRWMGLAQHMQSFGNNMQRIAAGNADAYKVTASERDEARRWAAWFAAERDYWRDAARTARGVVVNLLADKSVLTGQLRVSRARITELEAERDIAQGQWRLSGGEALTARDDLDKARARITEWRVHFAEIVDALGEPEDTRFDALPEVARKLRARIDELEAPASEPHAYIAVKRLHSPNATKPEWDAPARVIPAGDPHGVQDWYEREGYEFLPIVGTDTGTRFAGGGAQ